MKTLILRLLLLALTIPCLGLMSLERVMPARAKELGITVRATAAGPDAMRIELEFLAKGTLQKFYRVDLEQRDGDRLLLSATLKPDERTKADRVLVGFAADRGQLDKLYLRVVAGDPGNFSGHDLRLKDFVDLAKIR